MAPLDYILLRLVRRLLPPRVLRGVLKLGVGICPGLETRQPEVAARRYQEALRAKGRSLEGLDILVLGYGGCFGLALELLRGGAHHIVLLDPYAVPDEAANRTLISRAGPYLEMREGRVVPAPRWITLIHDRIEHYTQHGGRPVDLVLSSSVLEHLEDPEAVTAALVDITKPTGYHLHYVDLRDHFFRYPFEMLTFSEDTWRRYLNPPSNLNRWRLWEYEELFRRHFVQVLCEVVERDVPAFRRARTRIRPQFLCGDDAIDAATRLLVHAWEKRV